MMQHDPSLPYAHTTPRHDFGPRLLPSGEVEFRVWAPKCASLELVLVDASTTSYRMSRHEDGMFSLTTKVPPDARYYFRLPNGNLRPDPASRFQPDGVHGPSQIVAPELFDWTDQSWRGIDLSALIIYELHIGTFTTAGTYRAAIDRLDELVELGITAIELMPLNQSAGLRNWGYDGVNLYAPRNTFGTPHDLAALVDAAHARGIAVILDVVYNHFGPEGNYLHDFGSYVSDRHQSAWGDTPNFDGQHSQFVRDFILGNAAYWIEELHFDGLRLDATHCMIDDSSPHVVHELGVLFAELQSRHTRQLHLIAESNIYDPELLSPIDGGGHGFTSEWCDDFIHSVLAILRPGEHMSNRQYGPHDDLAVVLQRGYVFQGTLTEPRRRVPLAAASTRAPRERLVFAIQNHDFIGNHPRGERLHQLSSPDAHRAAAALLLIDPAIPMLFMGEEFASPNPFFFFADFGDSELRRGVEEGRKREYPQHDWSQVSSPLAEAAFTMSYIGSADTGDQTTLAWYRQLIRLRREFLRAGFLRAGFLAPENSSHYQAHWDTANHLAHVTYGNGVESAFAVIRLHPTSAQVQSVQIELEGSIRLSQQCEPTRDGVVLGPYGVAIGLGVVAHIGHSHA